MKTSTKCGIGAAGALCLSLLKLISVNFHLSETNVQIQIGAYLVYGAYVLLGMAAAVFLTEEEQDTPRGRRNVFVAGLLAPSLLIAIVNGHNANGGASSTTAPSSIPSLSSLFIQPAYAQEAAMALEQRPIRPVRISKEDVTPSYSFGARQALGIGRANPDHLVILGKSEDTNQIAKRVIEVQRYLDTQQKTLGANKVIVVQPAGEKTMYLAVGDLQSPQSAKAISEGLKAQALRDILNTNYPNIEAARLILKSKVIDAEALVK